MNFKATISGLAALTLASAAAAQETYAQTRALSLYNQLIEPGGCESALPVARQFWRTREFQDQLAREDQEGFLSAVMQCALSLGDGREAIDAANAVRDLGANWIDRARLEMALFLQDDALAAEAFLDLARTSPKEFGVLESYNAWGALRAAERIEGGESVVLSMHEALLAANYAPPEGYYDDYFRLDHARLLLEEGRTNEARARLEGVVDPRAILTVRINRLYDPLRRDSAFERRLDVERSAEAALERARRAVGEDPRRLSLVLQLTSTLRDLGRSQEALAVLEPVLLVAQGPEGEARFDDLTTQLNWIVYAKADILYDLGRNTEARTIYAEAIAAQGIGQGNIVLTFAGMLNAEGRGADALAVLELAPRAPPAYADVWLQSERACAAHLAGDAPLRDEALARMRRNEMDDAAAAMHALLCVNDIDGAAALMIRRLQSPAHREAALVALQPFRRLETRRMPAEVVELERLQQVRERADVRAAVEPVGRLESSPLYSH